METDIQLQSSMQEDLIEFVGYSLISGGSICIKLVYDCSGCEEADDLYAVINATEYPLEQDTQNPSYKYIKYSVPAKKMGDKFIVNIYSRGTESPIFTGENFSIRDFLEKVISGEYAASDSLKKLCNCMNEYGKAAQIYFNYKADEVDKHSYTGYEAIYKLDNYSTFSIGTLPEGLSYRGLSLVLEDNILIRHYFALQVILILMSIVLSLLIMIWQLVTRMIYYM